MALHRSRVGDMDRSMVLHNSRVGNVERSLVLHRFLGSVRRIEVLKTSSVVQLFIKPSRAASQEARRGGSEVGG